MRTQSPFRSLGLVSKPASTQNAAGRTALSRVASWLVAHTSSCWIESDTAAQLDVSNKEALKICSLSDMPGRVDAILVVGGDGTMLATARDLAAFQVPLIGMNQGHLGFMTDMAVKDFEAPLSAVLAGDYSLEARSMIAGTLVRGQETVATALALNDAVISRGASSSMVDVSVHVNGRTAYRLRADGLVVATPTGSTAYSLSANGPIVHPGVAGFVVVPVAPQTLSNRPIVLPDDCVIDVVIEPSRSEGMSASFDMQQWQSLRAGDLIRIEKSSLSTLLVHPASYDYYHTLRQKLHWTYNPVQSSV